MPRSRKANGHAPETAEELEDRAAATITAGSNVTDATAREHYGRIVRLEEKLASVRQELTTAYENAEKAGIEKKPFKAAMKLMKQDPASANAYLRKLNQYTTQLGLLDRIADWKAAEEQEANAGSVARAEGDLKKPKKAKAAPADAAEPTSGGRDEAIYAQGYQAGLDGVARTTCPSDFDQDAQDTWVRGHHAGAMKRVDDANSARPDAGVSVLDEPAEADA